MLGANLAIWRIKFRLSKIQNDLPFVDTTISSSFTIMSVIGTCGKLVCKDCQDLPEFTEKYMPFSVPANRSPGTFTSSLMTLVNSIRELKNQINHWKTIITNSGNHNKVLNQVDLASRKLTEIEANLIQIGISRPGTDRWLDRWNVPGKISDKLTELIAVVSSADSKPTKQSIEVFSELSILLTKQLDNFKKVQKNNIAPLNTLIRKLNIDPIPLSQ